MTEPEVWLWSRLKRLHAKGYHFRRQHPFKGYFLDFACIDRMVVVEVDGSQHNDGPQWEHDGVRDAVLKRAGNEVLRFPNSAIRTNIVGVMDTILQILEARPSRFGRSVPANAPREPDSPTLAASRPVPPLKRRDG
jgi:very-short-patch-repair endonuclease